MLRQSHSLALLRFTIPEALFRNLGPRAQFPGSVSGIGLMTPVPSICRVTPVPIIDWPLSTDLQCGSIGTGPQLDTVWHRRGHRDLDQCHLTHFIHATASVGRIGAELRHLAAWPPHWQPQPQWPFWTPWAYHQVQGQSQASRSRSALIALASVAPAQLLALDPSSVMTPACCFGFCTDDPSANGADDPSTSSLCSISTLAP